MMNTELSPYRLAKARRIYNIYNLLNSISWSFLAGNIITLLAMRMHASSTMIGILNAINFASFFCMLIGRKIARHFTIIKIFSVAWCSRSIAMLPLLIAPFFGEAGYYDTAITLMLIGVTLFHIARGIGMVANNPVLSFLARGSDRSSYMTLIQIIANGSGVLSTLALAFFLGGSPPLYIYSILMGAGVVLGFTSGLTITRLPEPDENEKAISDKFGTVLRETVTNTAFRFFIIIMLLSVMVSAIVRSFVLVYAREVFKQDDSMIAFYSAAGTLGAIAIGFGIKFVIDRVGARPIYMLCVAFGIISIIPLILFPAQFNSNILLIVFLSFVFFIVNYAFLGTEGVGQTYFLNLAPKKYIMDMSIIYYLVYATAGAGGTFLAGFLLDSLRLLEFSYYTSFKVLFIFCAAVLVVVLLLQRKLIPMGAIPTRNAIGLIFSPRDLRAIALLDKLDKSSDPNEEETLLEELGDTPSTYAVTGILDKVRSPRFTVRVEALNALANIDTLALHTIQILLDDLAKNHYTTAYISARILGKHKIKAAIPELRAALRTKDHILCGEVMIALARLGDKESYETMSAIVRETTNPRLKIMGFEAMAISHSVQFIPVLADGTLAEETVEHVKDEAALALASILGCANEYYALLSRLLSNEDDFPTIARDIADEATASTAALARDFGDAVEAYLAKDGAPLAKWISRIPDNKCDETQRLLLMDVVTDARLTEHNRIRLLIILWALRRL